MPKSSRAWGDTLLPTLIAATAIALVTAICLILLYAPNEQTLGFVQRIFYFHVPSAILGYLGFTICFCASILYLFRGGAHIDAVARVGALIGIVFFSMTLTSGPLWAKKSWGTFWTGEPRLVLALALFVIFLSYVLVRELGGRSELTRRIGAVLAIFGFADIPLVRYAVRKWGGHHPELDQALTSEMFLTLAVSFIAFILLFIVLFWVRLRDAFLEERLLCLERDLADRELVLEET